MFKAAISVLALIAALAFTAGISRASNTKVGFDCVQKPNPLDQIICETPSLARLNEDMSDAYRRALNVVPNAELLEFQQDVWMLSLESACPAAPTSEICISERLKSRLGLLVEYRAAKLYKCNLLRSNLAKLACEEPRLIALAKEIDQKVETLTSIEKDPLHAKQIRQDQEDWWIDSATSLYSAAACPEKFINNCIRHLAQGLNARLAQLNLLIPTKDLPTSIPFDPPDDWWGVDIASFAPKESATLEAILTGPNHSLVIGVDINGSERRLIDVISGKVVASSNDDPDLLAHPVKAGSAYKKYGLTKLGHSYGTIPLSADLKVGAHSNSCGGPLDSYLAHIDEGRGTLNANSRYLVRRLPASKTFVESVRCEGIYEVTWTAPFVPVQPNEIFRFPNGTILVQFRDDEANRDYLIRFRFDLTSPFFYKRSDLLLLSRIQTGFLPDSGQEAPVEALSEDYIAALTLLLDRTARNQMADAKLR